MKYTLLVHHTLGRSFLIFAFALLMSFHTAYATSDESKQPDKRTRLIPQLQIADPTNTQEVIRIFGSLPLDNFRTWLTAELPLPPSIDQIAFAPRSSTRADQYCFRSYNLRTVATASAPRAQTLQA